MKSQFMFDKRSKTAIGLVIIAAFSPLILVIPDIIGMQIGLSLKLSVMILLFVYIVLFAMVHRTAIVLAGAALLVITGITTGLFEAKETFHFVIESIDFNTIGLLLGMMIIVAVPAQTGVFQYIGIRMSTASKGNMWKLMLPLATFTAVTSMFIDNVTTVLLMVPVTISVFKVLRLSPMPFILAQALASNVGGTATLIGDPPKFLSVLQPILTLTHSLSIWGLR